MGEYRKEKPKYQSKKKKRYYFQLRPLKALARYVYIRDRPIPDKHSDIVTRALINDFKWAYARRWNATIGIEGGPGEGKSEQAFSFAKMLWLPLTGGGLHVTWDIDELPDMNDGDWLHIDEWIIPEGAGKIKTINRIWNLFTTLRAKQICVSIATPSLPELRFSTFFATTFGQDFRNRANRAEIRVPLPRRGTVYIGNAIIPLHGDEKFREKYEKDSKSRKDKIAEEDGGKTIKQSVGMKEAAEIAVEFAKKEGWKIERKGQALSVLEMVAEEHGWNSSARWYKDRKDIADIITMIAEKNNYSAVMGSSDYEGQTVNLREAVLEQLGYMGIHADHLIWFKEYIEGETQRDIGARHGVDQSTVSQAVGSNSPLRTKALGYAFEKVYEKRLKDEGQICYIGGSNKPAPDCVILREELPEEILEQDQWWRHEDIDVYVEECHSLKCYFDKSARVSIPFSELAKSEIYLKNLGVPTYLVFYNIVWDQMFEAQVKNQQSFEFRRKV